MKRMFFLLLFIISIPSLFGVTIYLSQIDYYETNKLDKIEPPFNIKETLTKDMESLFSWEMIQFKELPEGIESPQSFLEAMQISKKHSLDYIIYGFIEKKEFSLYGELKFFDGQKGEVVQVFYSSDSDEKLERLIVDLEQKIKEYLETIYQLNASGEKKTEATEGIFSLLTGAGFWVTMTEEWYQYVQPLYFITFQMRVIPWRPAAGKGFRGVYFKTGLSFDFAHGINVEGIESFNLYQFHIGLPLFLSIDLGIRHTINLGLEPEFSIDHLVLKRLYAGELPVTSFLFSLSNILEYQFHITKFFSIVVGNQFDIQFTNPVRVNYAPYLLVEFNFMPISGGIKK